MSQRRTPGGQGPARRQKPVARAARGPAAPREPRKPLRLGEPARSASRPATARRGGGGGAAKRTTAPRPRRLTGRATVLLVILTALALGYTYPVRVYLDQQSDIARMQAAQEQQRTRIDELREEVAKWQDDEYVISQARSRFYFVRPGETPLIPIWDTGDQPPAGTPAEEPAERTPAWYDTLWSSIQAADGAGQP